MTTQAPIKTFKTRDEALAYATDLDRGTYYLSHGEYARPEYTVRKVRGNSEYYIHARYSYYHGTFHAKQNGPLLDY
jgi:hypothetical protein